MRTCKVFFLVLLAGATLTGLWACSSGNPEAPTLNASGQHPATWVADHPSAFFDRSDQCYECHGKDLAGGISKVSCFSASLGNASCHANGPGIHPAGWGNAPVHGTHAKAPVSGADGFPPCQGCHGTLFEGGKARKACASCHGVPAPHPRKPWLGGAFTHVNTDPSNVGVCALCHTAGKNLNPERQQAQYATGTPGCFNNTLCHGDVGHPTGFDSPTVHGPVAKGKPSSTEGLAHCKVCHGNDYKGIEPSPSCFPCHRVNAPHPPKPWRTGKFSHASTDPGNAATCADCHTAGLNSDRKPNPAAPAGTSPGCFNNTLCHGNVGHPSGWVAPGNHGVTAKALPGPTSGFDSCRTCHGPSFAGDQPTPSCLNTGTCHGPGIAAPHPKKPWTGTLNHGSTNSGNAPMCNLCHNNGANSSAKPGQPAPPGTPPGCFNSTLCHGSIGHQANFAPPNLHGAQSKSAPGATTGFDYCRNCHGSLLNGGTAQTCVNFLCHGSGVQSPHAGKPWRGTAITHTNTDTGNAQACALCHTAGANLSPSLKLPGYSIGVPGCYNNTLCHGTANAHPQPWKEHNVAGNIPNACQTCHGVQLQGDSIVGSPACYSCHIALLPPAPPGTVPIFGQCVSCHGKPPQTGQHSFHSQLGFDCPSCHFGVGYGTIGHGPPRAIARVIFSADAGTPPPYNYTQHSCSSIACHADLGTRGWQ
jgi:hypothetical protein